ncbi:MAG TPA: 16S rRNA (cytidine(1402)-2'-O)-methyltransferase [Candidatus Stackebrandtia faecavium]|nr:16S rRNA (cytidine(1402)-2'-O)-methyltransferase [Candidatus Stackebrandtia faecavium]
MSGPCLILLGAPLGNPSDASPRLAQVLRTVDVIAAEDTRRLRRLADDIGAELAPTIVSYFDGNEKQRTLQLRQRLAQGETVALITDGGMPSVSDPGYRLVNAAIADNVAITCVPGPSAVTTALALSGLPCDRFCFEGFLPRKHGERATRLTQLSEEARTMVFYESPRRISATLGDLASGFGSERPAALCRELTKTYEDIRRGTLEELVRSVDAVPPRGEITLVVAGYEPEHVEATTEAMAAAVAQLIDDGVDRKQALSDTAKRFGVPKREVYDAVVQHRDQ